MVTKNETTHVLTQPKLEQVNQPSLKRWFKHAFYFQSAQRIFTKQDQAAIAEAVCQAEQGHVGEIQVVIEGRLPYAQAYYHNTRYRAEQLFAELGVWDTEHNSGILLYINLCERQVELVIDRGISALTTEDEWQAICHDMLVGFRAQHYVQAVNSAVGHIGAILNRFYASYSIEAVNELNNAPVVLR